MNIPDNCQRAKKCQAAKNFKVYREKIGFLKEFLYICRPV